MRALSLSLLSISLSLSFIIPLPSSLSLLPPTLLPFHLAQRAYNFLSLLSLSSTFPNSLLSSNHRSQSSIILHQPSVRKISSPQISLHQPSATILRQQVMLHQPSTSIHRPPSPTLLTYAFQPFSSLLVPLSLIYSLSLFHMSFPPSDLPPRIFLSHLHFSLPHLPLLSVLSFPFPSSSPLLFIHFSINDLLLSTLPLSLTSCL